MKTLEEILINQENDQLSKFGGAERVITILKITYPKVEQVKQLNIALTGYEALALISSIEDETLRKDILNKTFSLRVGDIHSKAKWTVVLISLTILLIMSLLTFNSIYYHVPLDEGDKSVYSEILKTILEAIRILVSVPQ